MIWRMDLGNFSEHIVKINKQNIPKKNIRQNKGCAIMFNMQTVEIAKWETEHTM